MSDNIARLIAAVRALPPAHPEDVAAAVPILAERFGVDVEELRRFLERPDKWTHDDTFTREEQTARRQAMAELEAADESEGIAGGHE